MGKATFALASLLDEILLVTLLVPFMVTNLKAKLNHKISVTGASPSGGGAAVASTFKGRMWQGD